MGKAPWARGWGPLAYFHALPPRPVNDLGVAGNNKPARLVINVLGNI